MATTFPAPVSVVQVGSYFVGQYYQVLQRQPDLVHQFYTDESTMLRIDGDVNEQSASAMGQIHALIMSLNFTGIEIKTAHSLESLNGGILVLVSGSVQAKEFSGRRKFVQTFFLAPQEKGYFVLNDIFHFIDEEQIHQHTTAISAQNNPDSDLSASSPPPEPVSDYMLEEESQAREFVALDQVEENVPVDKYSLPEQQQQQVPEAENIVEETPAVELTASLQSTIYSVPDPQPVPVEEPVGEPPKKTYASILRVAKGNSTSSVPPQTSFNKSSPPTSELHHAPEATSQQFYPAFSIAPEKSWAEAGEENFEVEEGEIRSVYVRNLPSTVSASDIEQEFMNFGRIKPDGVAIRNRKEIGVCYAFVEFQDALGVQNAIKASPIQFTGRQVHIEERRANSSGTSRGGRRDRGRGSYQTEAPRGRFGSRSFGRGNGSQDGRYRDYSRPRGNGFHQRGPRQDRGILGNHVSKNEQNL